MRSLFAAALALFALTFTGCGSMPSRVRERFQAAQPQIRSFDADQRRVFDAAKLAMQQIDFRVTRSGAAQGVINGLSRIDAGESFGKARQYAMDVRLTSVEPGRTDVAVVLREQEESSSFAGATDIPLRAHGLYDSFFAALEHALAQTPGVTR